MITIRLWCSNGRYWEKENGVISPAIHRAFIRSSRRWDQNGEVKFKPAVPTPMSQRDEIGSALAFAGAGLCLVLLVGVAVECGCCRCVEGAVRRPPLNSQPKGGACGFGDGAAAMSSLVLSRLQFFHFVVQQGNALHSSPNSLQVSRKLSSNIGLAQMRKLRHKHGRF